MKLRSILLFCALSHLINPTISDAQWAPNGNALCTATGSQSHGGAISDGAGGAIIVWADNRSGNSDIYAQRVNALGVVQWTADGVDVRSGTSSQASPTIASDGTGGAIIFFTHLANNGSTDIYAQRIDASGVKQWTTDGVLISSAQNDQHSPRAVSDGQFGAIVTWLDNRDGDFSTSDVYARRINILGVPQWAADGVAVCTAANRQVYATPVADGTGGAIIVWSDNRNGEFVNGVYARRVDAAGVAQWTANGVQIDADATNGAEAPVITTDGSGGAIVVWPHNLNSPNYYDLYAQRINPSGTLLWGIGTGVPVCVEAQYQWQPDIVSDGAGGAIVAWMDERNGLYLEDDIYAQRLNGSGVPQWSPSGVPLCTAADLQVQPHLVPDGSHGAVVCWYDRRNGPGDDNVYARRINGAGTALWSADGVPLTMATSSQSRPMVVTDGWGGAIAVWDDYRSAVPPDIYANHVTPGGTVPTAVGETPAIPSIAVINYPNPFSTTTAIEITMAHEANVSVELFDVAGRRVRAMNVGRMVAGIRSLNFDGRDERGNFLPSGLYFYRIQAGSATVTRKMVIQR